jgi:PiT family inorganic phosphate transporter
MNEIQFVTYCGVGIALFFDFVNGFHDSANCVATVRGTKVLKPIYAVGIAAGWRIIRTMAFRLTDLKPYQGFCAETGG